jgi:hypothetical protein
MKGLCSTNVLFQIRLSSIIPHKRYDVDLQSLIAASYRILHKMHLNHQPRKYIAPTGNVAHPHDLIATFSGTLVTAIGYGTPTDIASPTSESSKKVEENGSMLWQVGSPKTMGYVPYDGTEVQPTALAPYGMPADIIEKPTPVPLPKPSLDGSSPAS